MITRETKISYFGVLWKFREKFKEISENFQETVKAFGNFEKVEECFRKYCENFEYFSKTFKNCVKFFEIVKYYKIFKKFLQVCVFTLTFLLYYSKSFKNH